MFLAKSVRFNKKYLLLAVVIYILLLLHFYVLPIANGGYNKECYLENEDLKNLRYAVEKIGQAMAKHNVTYWLDYGTLLGAITRKDILPWDADADISYLFSDDNDAFHKELYKVYGIRSNGLIASYKGLTIDYVRWKPIKGRWDGEETTLLFKYYPESVLKNENVIVLNHHKLQTFPKSWIEPRQTFDFHGVKLFIPNNPQQFLKHRYSFTYTLGLSFPYKWKCWVPCLLRKARGCS